jgi:hypothetical protein
MRADFGAQAVGRRVVQLGQPLDDVQGMPPGVAGFAGLAEGVESVADACSTSRALSSTTRILL